jgi:hypothetical protein
MITNQEFQFSTNGHFHRVLFENGIAYTDSDEVVDYFRGRNSMGVEFEIHKIG